MTVIQRAAAMAGANPQTYVEDVFSAYTYTGNGSTQTIANGVDLSGKGGLVWIKGRSYVEKNSLFNTINGALNYLQTDATNALGTTAVSLTSFNSNGFSLGAAGAVNGGGDKYIGWSFAQANKFFKVAQATVSGGVTATVDLSSLGTVGMVAVKRTDSTSDWYWWHRELSTGKLVYLNKDVAETTDGSISVSGTTLSLVGGTIANGTYIVYAWAHDTASTGLIQCGSFTTDGSGFFTTNLGWEPQYIIYKNLPTAARDPIIHDTARAWTNPANNGQLYTSLANAEATGSTTINLLNTGFSSSSGTLVSGAKYIYIAIRRGPMKLPTSGTQVYNAIARTNNGTETALTGVGFPPDLVFCKPRAATWTPIFNDRLRGINRALYSATTGAEDTTANAVMAFGMDGYTVGTDSGGVGTNYSTHTNIHQFLRRYPGVFQEVNWYCGTNTNRSIDHGLTVAPELIIIKNRDSAGTNWWTYHSALGLSAMLSLNATDASTAHTNAWGTSGMSATTFSIDENYLGANGKNHIAYLFATLAGVSKVGSYTGNGSSLTINCGFAAGARFFMCKRTDSTGDWFLWDSTRGIVAGNDPHLSLNTTAAEVTGDDSVDPDNSGIIVNENATTHINVNNATYIYLAFA